MGRGDRQAPGRPGPARRHERRRARQGDAVRLAMRSRSHRGRARASGGAMIGAILGASLGAAATCTLAFGAYHPNCGLFGPVIGRGPRRGRALYLTFDDGPNPTATERIAEVLSLHRVPAAFFMVG